MYLGIIKFLIPGSHRQYLYAESQYCRPVKTPGGPNVPVEYVLYPDEGHGFVKKENQMATSKRTLEFLDKYLKPKETVKK